MKKGLILGSFVLHRPLSIFESVIETVKAGNMCRIINKKRTKENPYFLRESNDRVCFIEI